MRVLIPIFLCIDQTDESEGKHSPQDMLNAAEEAVQQALETIGNEMGFSHGLDTSTEISDIEVGNAEHYPDGCVTGAQAEAENGYEHPEWTRSEWRNDVENEDTRLGYWDWVAHQLNRESDEEEDTDAEDQP